MNQVNKKILPPRLNTPKLLVIEDNEDQWHLTEKAIKECSMEVNPVWVNNGNKALAYLEDCLLIGSGLPFFILLDLYLPDREDGWAVLEKIRSQKSPIDYLPIIVLSSSGYDVDIAKSYDRGITSYVVKPTDFNDWITTFQAIKEYWLETVALPELRY